MQLTYLKGYPDRIGKRFAWVAYGNGPASYVQVTATGGGDPLILPSFDTYIDYAEGATDTTRTYIARPVPVAVGNRPTYRIQWVVISSGLEVAANTNLSTVQVQLAGLGGMY